MSLLSKIVGSDLSGGTLDRETRQIYRDLRRQDAKVARLYRDHIDQYNPTFQELDVGVTANTNYPDPGPPKRTVFGANDGEVAVAEFLQGYVNHMWEKPQERRWMADPLKDATGVCVPFLATDCSPTEHMDNLLEQRILSSKDKSLAEGFDVQGLQSHLNNFPAHFSSRRGLPVSGVDTFLRVPTNCVGGINQGAAVASYVTSDMPEGSVFEFVELYAEAGYRDPVPHVFGRFTFEGPLGGLVLYYDPTRGVNNQDVFLHSLPQGLVAQPVTLNEHIALTLVDEIRVARAGERTDPLPLEEELAKIDQALLFAPESPRVLLEAARIHSKNGDVKQSQEYLLQAAERTGNDAEQLARENSIDGFAMALSED